MVSYYLLQVSYEKQIPKFLQDMHSKLNAGSASSAETEAKKLAMKQERPDLEDEAPLISNEAEYMQV